MRGWRLEATCMPCCTSQYAALHKGWTDFISQVAAHKNQLLRGQVAAGGSRGGGAYRRCGYSQVARAAVGCKPVRVPRRRGCSTPADRVELDVGPNVALAAEGLPARQWHHRSICACCIEIAAGASLTVSTRSIVFASEPVCATAAKLGNPSLSPTPVSAGRACRLVACSPGRSQAAEHQHGQGRGCKQDAAVSDGALLQGSCQRGSHAVRTCSYKCGCLPSCANTRLPGSLGGATQPSAAISRAHVQRRCPPLAQLPQHPCSWKHSLAR